MTSNAAIPPAWLPLSAARAYSGIGRNMLRYLADTGQIKCGRTEGGHRRFHRESIDQYLSREEIDRLVIHRAVGL